MRISRSWLGFVPAALVWGAILVALAAPVAGAEPMSSVQTTLQRPGTRRESRVPQESPPPPSEEEPRVARRQRDQLLKSNLEKMRQDADEMADLVKSLQEDLRETNQNVLSLKIVQRAEKIEKLAKRIKDTARGY